MTNKQKMFCLEYASCGNATQSAIKAGYSKKTARSIGQTPAHRTEGSPGHRTYPRCIGRPIVASAGRRKALQPKAAIFEILNLTF